MCDIMSHYLLLKFLSANKCGEVYFFYLLTDKAVQ